MTLFFTFLVQINAMLATNMIVVATIAKSLIFNLQLVGRKSAEKFLRYHGHQLEKNVISRKTCLNLFTFQPIVSTKSIYISVNIPAPYKNTAWIIFLVLASFWVVLTSWYCPEDRLSEHLILSLIRLFT